MSQNNQVGGRMNKNSNSRGVVSPEEKKMRVQLSQLYLKMEIEGLITKNAGIGDQRVSYCRGKDLLKVFEAMKEEIAKEITEITGEDIGVRGNNALQNFYNIFLKRGMLIKADRFEEDIKKAFPRRLKPLHPSEFAQFDEKKLYVVNIDRPASRSNYVYLFICIFLVLFVCTFPIWPLSLKIGIWWVLFITMLSMLALIGLRIVIFFIGYILGYDVWVLPNLLSDRMPFMESLSPIIGYYPREDSWDIITFRISIVLLFIAFGVHLYMFPEYITMIYDTCAYIYNASFQWGSDKLTNYHSGNRTSLSIMDRHERIMQGINDELNRNY